MQRTPASRLRTRRVIPTAMSDKLRHRTQPAPRGALSNRALVVFGAIAAAIAHLATSLV